MFSSGGHFGNSFGENQLARDFGLADSGRPGNGPNRYAPSDGGFLAGATQDENNQDTTLGHSFDERKKAREGLQLFPLKVSMVHKAFVDNPHEHRLKIFDEDVSMFKLIGLVRDLEIDPVLEKWKFTLDDGTGSLGIEWLANRHREYNEVEPSPWTKETMSQIQNGSYVRVHGDINFLGKLEPHVSAFLVNRVEIPEEIFYHDLVVTECILSKTRSNYFRQLPGSNSAALRTQITDTPQSAWKEDSSNPVTPNAYSQRNSRGHLEGHGNQPGMSNSARMTQRGTEASSTTRDASTSDKAPLKPAGVEAIVDIVRNMSAFKPRGLDEGEIAAQLMGRGIGADIEVVREACNRICSQGRISKTKDGTWTIDSSGGY